MKKSLQVMLLPTLNSSIGSFIGGFQDMETRVSVKFSYIYVALVIRVQKIHGQKLYIICCLF